MNEITQSPYEKTLARICEETPTRIYVDGADCTYGDGFTRRVLDGVSVTYDLTEGKIPIVTTADTEYKACFQELLLLNIKGSGHIGELRRAGCDLWKYDAVTENTQYQGDEDDTGDAKDNEGDNTEIA